MEFLGCLKRIYLSMYLFYTCLVFIYYNVFRCQIYSCNIVACVSFLMQISDFFIPGDVLEDDPDLDFLTGKYIYLSFHLSISFYLSLFLSISLSIYLSNYIYLSIYLSIQEMLQSCISRIKYLTIKPINHNSPQRLILPGTVSF